MSDLTTARREAGKLSTCAWCGAALVQDPDALHRWRCINAEQGKCVARGYWYILTDDLDYVPALLAAPPEPAPALPEEVREAAEAFRRVNAAQRDDSCTDAGCIVCKRREAGDRLLAALAARGGR